MALFSSYKVSDLIKETDSKSDLIEVKSTSPVRDVLFVLTNNNIYSCPVKDSSSSKYIGFVDLLDVVSFIVDLFDLENEGKSSFDNNNVPPAGIPKSGNIGKFVSETLMKESRFDTIPVSEICDMSKRNPFHSVSLDMPLKDLMDIFAHGKGEGFPINRVAVVSQDKIVNIVTQSNVLFWLHKHIGPVAIPASASQTDPQISFIDKSLEVLNLHQKEEMISCPANMPTLDALRTLSEHRINGMPLTDGKDGPIVTNLSVKDLRALTTNMNTLFNELHKSCLDFASTSRRMDITAPTFAASVICHKSDTLRTVINKLSIIKIHRIYVIDEKRKPVGVVSLADIIKLLVEEE